MDLGTDVSYTDGMAAMRNAAARVDEDGPTLLLLEHSPVITTTRSGGSLNIVTNAELLSRDGIELVETDRGGDVTFHGPGQLVGYPVVRLCPAGTHGDMVGYLRALEDSLVRACIRLGVGDAHPVPGLTGVWCDAPVLDSETLGCHLAQVSRQTCKLVAIGVGVGRGVTRHGFALNITTALERYTRHIVPCGLVGRGVTSLERVLPRIPSRASVVQVVREEVAAALAPWTTSTSSLGGP